MKINKTWVLLVLIFLMSLTLRLWRLGEIPPSIHWDEAAFGYNAFSILNTARDEYGNFLPLILKSFGDYKPAFYVYLAAISVGIFGLNEFAVRLPAALFGSLNVVVLFFVVRRIFKDVSYKEILGFISALVLALSPWSFHYSHGAWEGNVLMFFILLGMWSFLKAIECNYKFFYLSALSFGLSFYVYQGAKLLIPLIVFGLLISFWQKVIKIPTKYIAIVVLVGVVLASPIFLPTFFGGAGGRMKTMSIFSYPRLDAEKEKIIYEEGKTKEDFEYNLFHGDFNYYLRGIVGRYVNYFSPRFLFFEGDWSDPRHGVPSAGVLNILNVLFLPLGAYFLISRRLKNQTLVWSLLLVAPLPAALTRDIIQATRSYFMVVPLTIICAFGIYFVFEKLSTIKNQLKFVILVILVIGYLFGFVYYLDQFFIHAPAQNSRYWLYGYKEAVKFAQENKKDYEKVVFTQKYGQPYIYYLFYTKYLPSLYQAQAKLAENPTGDVGTVNRLENIEFRNIYWPTDRSLKKTLFIGDADELPKKDIVEGESKTLKEINFLDGSPAFVIVKTLK